MHWNVWLMKGEIFMIRQSEERILVDLIDDYFERRDIMRRSQLTKLREVANMDFEKQFGVSKKRKVKRNETKRHK